MGYKFEESEVDMRIMVEYGLGDTIAKMFKDSRQAENFEQAMKLVETLNQTALASLAIYIQVKLNDRQKGL